MSNITYIEALKAALREEMRRDKNVFIMGEDVTRYGFGVNRGLVDEFGSDRVRNTPISEAAIIGSAVGAALRGMRPVAEIMFVDFIMIGMDQIVNQAAKMSYLSNGELSVPMVIRTPEGTEWFGGGAQHSQTLHSMFMNIPGLKLVIPSDPYDAKGLLKSAIRDNNPVIFFAESGGVLRECGSPGRQVGRGGDDYTSCRPGGPFQCHDAVLPGHRGTPS